jgi:hypothetical protein
MEHAPRLVCFLDSGMIFWSDCLPPESPNGNWEILAKGHTVTKFAPLPEHHIFPAHGWEKISQDPKLKQEYEAQLLKLVPKSPTIAVTAEQMEAVKKLVESVAAMRDAIADHAKAKKGTRKLQAGIEKQAQANVLESLTDVLNYRVWRSSSDE